MTILCSAEILILSQIHLVNILYVRLFLANIFMKSTWIVLREEEDLED
jgi:hypothetical protein